MAYLMGLHDFGAATWIRSVAKVTPRTPEIDTFGELEREVIAIASRDRLSTLEEPGRLGRMIRLIFGVRASLRLADPRLEALRRIAVLIRHHGHAVAAEEVGAFLAAGYTRGQFRRLLFNAGVTPGRPVMAVRS